MKQSDLGKHWTLLYCTMYNVCETALCLSVHRAVPQTLTTGTIILSIDKEHLKVRGEDVFGHAHHQLCGGNVVHVLQLGNLHINQSRLTLQNSYFKSAA
jgi:hypothetical protein